MNPKKSTKNQRKRPNKSTKISSCFCREHLWLKRGINLSSSLKKIAISKVQKAWLDMDKTYNRYAKSFNLSMGTLFILELLYESEKIYNQKAISERLELPKQFVNSVMKYFLEQEYIELKESEDRRNKSIYLTERGKQFADLVLTPLNGMQATIWDSMTEEEIEILTNTIDKYNVAINKLLIVGNNMPNI